MSRPTRDMIAGVVLAAGGSTRMGSPKALLRLSGEPLVLAHVKALQARCGRVRVVVGAHGEAIVASLGSAAEIVRNPRWESSGPRESLTLALADLPRDTWVFITPVDVPPAPAEVLDQLLACGGPAVPCVHEEAGHPVLGMAGPILDALRAGTLRDALASAARVPVAWSDAVRNLNTPEDWAAWRGAQASAPCGQGDSGSTTGSTMPVGSSI